MERPFQASPEDAEAMSENGPDSPSSGDDVVKATEPSPKKSVNSKRGVQKRVVSVPIGDVEGSKSKGEAYPPPDSWAWRKYGQKPIKGSPYPRGYYRCSSSKGCPARKQVERSRVDPRTLIITYACDHNHPVPSKSHSPTSASASAASATSAAIIADEDPPKPLGEDITVFSGDADLEIGNSLLDGGYHHHHQWFDDVASTTVLESPIYGGAYVDADVWTAFSSVSGEDESLFADLGELPECSVVFRRRIVEPKEQNRRCGLRAVTG